MKMNEDDDGWALATEISVDVAVNSAALLLIRTEESLSLGGRKCDGCVGYGCWCTLAELCG